MTDKVMDLVTLLRQVPHLLLACLNNGNNSTQLRVLRSVNKECSIVAIMGLKSFAVNMMGLFPITIDTHIGCTRVLKHASLRDVRLKILLSGND